MKKAPGSLPAAQPWEPSWGLALSILLALPVVLFWPALLGGKMLWGADIQTLELVFKAAVQRGFAQGEWPLWMPEILGGMPGIAASNLVFLHPLELLFCLLRLPPWMGFGLDAAAEVALSGLGMWFLLQRLGTSRSASLLGALAFAASGTQVSLLYAGHINNIKGIAMIPWVFWGALKGWQEHKLSAWALCGAALALQVLGLGLQIFAYTIIALGAWVAWLAWTSPSPRPFSADPAPEMGEGWPQAGVRVRPASPAERGARSPWLTALVGLSVAALFGFLLAAPQLLPSLQYKAYSWREGFSYDAFTSWSFDPKEALAWVVPGYFGWREPTYHGSWPFNLTTEYFGLLPWALAFAALGAWRASAPIGPRPAWLQRLRKPEGYFLALGLFSFLAGIGKYFPLHHLFFHLPIYSGFRTWTRFLCLMTFSVAVLAAFGWDALRRDGSWVAAWKGALAFVALAVALSLGALLMAPGGIIDQGAALTQKLGAEGPAQVLELARSSALRALALAGLLAAALFGWARWRSLAFPLLMGALVFHAIDISEVGRRYLDFRDPGELMQRPALLGVLPDPQGPEPYRVLDLPGLWQQNAAALHGYQTVTGYHGVQMAAPMRLQQALAKRQLEWISLMNGRYLLSPQPLALPGAKALANGPSYAYENPYALPRAFVLGASQPVSDDAAAFAALALPGFDVLHKVTLDADLGLSGPAPAHGVQWLHNGRNHLSLQASSAAPALLVLSQTWYPSWNARLDGQPVRLYKADGGALSAVALPAGAHQLDLDFDPSLILGSAGLAALGLAGLAWLLYRERKEAA